MQLMQINSKVFLVLLLDIIPVTQPFFKKKKKLGKMDVILRIIRERFSISEVQCR